MHSLQYFLVMVTAGKSNRTHKRSKSSCETSKMLKLDMTPQGLTANKTNNIPCVNIDIPGHIPSGGSKLPHFGDQDDGEANLCGAEHTYIEEKAICFDNAYKHYGKGRSRTPVLLGLDMNVERGTIYGLLGNINKHRI